MKKITWKKVTAMMMMAALIGSLAGCEKGETDIQEAVTAEEGALGKYKETVTCNIGRSTIANPKFPEGDSYENNAYTRYLEERLNIKVVDAFEANGEDYDRQVSLAIASEDLPDIMKVTSKDVLNELVENDLVEDLTDVYEEYASDNIKEIYDSYGGRCLDSVTYDGKMMALPGTNADTAPSQVFVRADWIEKLNMTVDEDGDRCITIDELEKIAKTFMEADPEGTGNPVGMAFVPYLVSGDYGGSGYTINAIASAFKAYPGTWLTDENGKVYNSNSTDNMKQALAQVAEWYKDGIVDPQLGTRTWDDITALLTNGQMGIAFGPWHLPDWLLNNVKSMNAEADFNVYAICDDEGKVNVTHDNAVNGYMVVRKGFSNPEALIKMANLYFDDVVNNPNLEEEAPEVSQYLKEVDNSAKPVQVEIQPATFLLDDYTDIERCVNGEIALEEVRTAESKSIVASVERYNENPDNADVQDWSKYTSRMKGISLIKNLTENDKFTWNTPAFFDTTETMKTKNADLDKLREQTFVAIVTGAQPIDSYDDFINDWMSRGGEQITKEIQEVVDEK